MVTLFVVVGRLTLGVGFKVDDDIISCVWTGSCLGT